MNHSPHAVRAKARGAARRREDAIEAEEMESGEINLVPYLDIVTNLMLFILSTVAATVVLGQINVLIPDGGAPSQGATAPKPEVKPNEQDLRLFISVKKDQLLVWSATELEGTLLAPKLVLKRSGADGDRCDGDYMCESGYCESKTGQCEAPKPKADAPPAPRQMVFDYRILNDTLFQIVTQRYSGQKRALPTYRITLQPDQSVPYSTVVALMTAVRCKMPEFGKSSDPCLLPSTDIEIKDVATFPTGIDPETLTYDTERIEYDPAKHALFSGIILSDGFLN